MSPLALLVAVSLTQGAPNLISKKLENPLITKQKEKEELVNKLKRDIFKVDRSIGETERLIAKSRNAPYLPDLQFRLAEAREGDYNILACGRRGQWTRLLRIS